MDILSKQFNMKTITDMNYSLQILLGLGIVCTPMLTYMVSKKLSRKKIKDKKGLIVVITGCDSGIGLDLAQRMVAEGFIVIATVVDVNSFGGIKLQRDGATVMKVVYPKYEHIYAVSNMIDDFRQKGKKLHCLVNNSGVMVYGKSNWYTSHMIENQIDINLTGTVMMTKALLQTISKDKGRIVNVSSTMGILAAPFLSVYCATKAAIEAYSAAIRREGVHVVVVRPCNLPKQTSIMKSACDDLRAMKNSLHDGEYVKTVGPEIEATIQQLEAVFDYDSMEQALFITDKRLIRSLKDAILLNSPNSVYNAGPWYMNLFVQMCRVLPESALNLFYRWNIPFKIITYSTREM